MMGNQNKVEEPSADALLECFEIFDIKKSGRLTETQFRRILRGKVGEDEVLLEGGFCCCLYNPRSGGQKISSNINKEKT